MRRITSRKCPECGRVAAERETRTLGCGDLLLVLVSFGLWVPLRWAIGLAVNPWRCPECGRRV
jgi:predicted RNA-binding Zn-ribbon protein involved in translation (DUF1610 family)